MGWNKFISLEDFKDALKGYLIKDKCCIEAEVINYQTIFNNTLLYAKYRDHSVLLRHSITRPLKFAGRVLFF